MPHAKVYIRKSSTADDRSEIRAEIHRGTRVDIFSFILKVFKPIANWGPGSFEYIPMQLNNIRNMETALLKVMTNVKGKPFNASDIGNYFDLIKELYSTTVN